MSNAVAAPESTDLAERDEVALAIAAAQQDEFGDGELLQTPILKVGQALTKEVQDGEAEAGEFINTLTNEGLGNKVEFINAYYNKGRFASDDDGRAFVAFSSTIPANWEPLVGADYVDTPFSEHPEAEETYKERVNKKEIEWGRGPSISTTHNFTGLVLVEGEDGEAEAQPARLSLKRTDVPAARKINTLQRVVLRSKPAWDAVISLSTLKKDFGKNSAYVINPTDIKIVRKTTADEKELAQDLALAVMHGRTESVGAEDALQDRQSEPSDGGGLKV